MGKKRIECLENTLAEFASKYITVLDIAMGKHEQLCTSTSMSDKSHTSVNDTQANANFESAKAALTALHVPHIEHAEQLEKAMIELVHPQGNQHDCSLQKQDIGDMNYASIGKRLNLLE